eukprot:2119833-Rhodomonas_salina.1
MRAVVVRYPVFYCEMRVFGPSPYPMSLLQTQEHGQRDTETRSHRNTRAHTDTPTHTHIGCVVLTSVHTQVRNRVARRIAAINGKLDL